MEKLQYTLSYSSPPVDGIELQLFYRRIKTEQVGFVLKRGQPNYDFGKPKLAGLHPNLNCILTIEMTLRDWKGGREHCTVESP
jgi:hypothetical protein